MLSVSTLCGMLKISSYFQHLGPSMQSSQRILETLTVVLTLLVPMCSIIIIKYIHSSNTSTTFYKVSTGLYNILISSLIWINWAFFMVVCAAGDVLATFMLTYFGIIFFYGHCLLKYILAQHFSSFDLKFIYRLTVRA
jgi:hypothetical protein